MWLSSSRIWSAPAVIFPSISPIWLRIPSRSTLISSSACLLFRIVVVSLSLLPATSSIWSCFFAISFSNSFISLFMDKICLSIESTLSTRLFLRESYSVISSASFTSFSCSIAAKCEPRSALDPPVIAPAFVSSSPSSVTILWLPISSLAVPSVSTTTMSRNTYLNAFSSFGSKSTRFIA